MDIGIVFYYALYLAQLILAGSFLIIPSLSRMKYTFPFLGAALLLAVSAQAQSIDAQKVNFTYVRQPLVPVPAGTHTYTPEVQLRYVESVQQQKADHVTAVADAKAQAEKAKAEYKSLSLKDKAMNRILLDERKPGEAVIPTADYTAQVFDAPTLTATYVTLSGMQSQPANGDLHVTVLVDGFTQGPITPIQIKGSTMSVGGVSTGDGIKHAYEVSYKSPIAVKVTTKAGAVLLDEMMEATNTYTVVKTEAFATEEGLNKFWRNQPSGIFAPARRECHEDQYEARGRLFGQ